MDNVTLTFATRPSKLAHWQTEYVIQRLKAACPELDCSTITITTQGDKILEKPLPEIGGKGLFTQELEQALLASHVQAAVHSLKDLPIDDSPGLVIGAIPAREDPRDVLICPAGHTLDKLPEGAVVGTSSLRRQAQILAFRSDLRVASIRGNVDTRLRKVREGRFDAILLAAAGVRRLGLEGHITQYLPLDIVLPAPGQGALAIQVRVDDIQTLHILAAIEDEVARKTTCAERAFLAGLGGGCSLPVGAHATLEDGIIHLKGIVTAPDGSQIVNVAGYDEDPGILGGELARQALTEGALKIL